MKLKLICCVIPLKPRERSANWSRDSFLLDQTIASMLRQESIDKEQLHIIVVGHDRPNLAVLDNPAVTWLTSDVAIGPPRQAQLQYDKLSKCHRGLLHARSLSASHVMICDSDDLLHRGAFACIETLPPSDVYSVKWGYGYSVRFNRLYRINTFYGECASAHIYRADAIGLPRTMSRDEEAGCLPLHIEHGAVCIEALRRGLVLRYIPMRAATYIVDHGGNMLANVDKKLPLKVRLRHTIKHTLRWHPLTRRIQDDFGLQAYPAYMASQTANSGQ